MERSLVLRRLGSTPRQRGSREELSCPDIFELKDGRFAVIGTDMTVDLIGHLPPDAGVADYERIVVITRDTMLHAKRDIPDV
ncbi:hypothetical protein ACQP00_02210 [Dactylosporangium sp. CS-047395]|uniref:hypothetical protein n=1 Tax=Dactylosporangium sp. CS-047395 TaxID=3239936 RepID=UPI003D8BA269